ncbi:MAG: hypothetical protein QOE82_1505 [Thermoanaerobaculia bacterium]|jgi:hypothetical protein|nr:hypothetical protein [Thermoanaerobaculia bacterium]
MVEVLKVAAVVVATSVVASAIVTKLFIMFAQHVDSTESANRPR